MDLENLKKDFRRFILEQCASEVPIKGQGSREYRRQLHTRSNVTC